MILYKLMSNENRRPVMYIRKRPVSTFSHLKQSTIYILLELENIGCGRSNSIVCTFALVYKRSAEKNDSQRMTRLQTINSFRKK